MGTSDALGSDDGAEGGAVVFGESRQHHVNLLHSVAAAVQNGLYGHGGVDPGTAACYSAAEAVLVLLVPAGQGWCPVHGSALCPEEYMLRMDGRVAVGYRDIWSEDLRCGQRQPTYRVEQTGGSGASNRPRPSSTSRR